MATFQQNSASADEDFKRRMQNPEFALEWRSTEMWACFQMWALARCIQMKIDPETVCADVRRGIITNDMNQPTLEEVYYVADALGYKAKLVFEKREETNG